MSQSDLQFTFDDQIISAKSGQSVGAALLAADVRKLRTTRFDQNPRGVCFDCLVVIDGITNQRACIVEVKPGMKVQTQVGSNA